VRDTDPSLTTTTWRSGPVNQPEDNLLGSMFVEIIETPHDWVVQNANHWIYAGTGLANGDHLPTLVGTEYDRLFPNGYTPPGTIALSESPVFNVNGSNDVAHGTIYQARSGAYVFNAGTLHWPRKLSVTANFDEVDSRVQRMTKNLFDKFIESWPPPVPTPSTPDLSLGLAGYWPFDEAAPWTNTCSATPWT
jgi:hypothetical protein